MLAEALASVRSQTFTDYEIIVVSNGESDEMRRASREVVAAHDGEYFELKEGNLPAARNFGIAQARGDWIAFLDDDDIWLLTKLERQVAEAKRTDADMIACDYVEFYPDGREIVRQPRVFDGWSYTKAVSHQYWWAAPSTVIVRKRVLDDLCGFDSRQRYSEDIDMWRRISWRHSIHQMDEVLMRFRSGHASMMRQKRTWYAYDLRLFVKMHLDTPQHLRSALPSAATFVLPRLVNILAPNWLLHFFHWFGPRMRWLRFKRMLRPRTRWLAFRRWLNRAREPAR
jgi:glycosyltransferase involved in cell wall biosynthesis